MTKASSSPSMAIPECHYPNAPVVVTPAQPTPSRFLYLSNLDDQRFLRFSIKYLYVFARAVAMDALRASLSIVLVDYYPLAGRLRASDDGEDKLVVDCNGEGAVLAEAFLDATVEQFLEGCAKPNKSWRKLLYRVEAQSFVGVPPLVIQVTHLSCGGMILCTAINHCLCDGIGTAQFLHAWARATAKPDVDPLPAAMPFHDRHVLRPRATPRVVFAHPEYNAGGNPPHDPASNLLGHVVAQPLCPVSVTFTAAHILHIKKQCVPSLKCTSFEALASHVWRAWVGSLDPPHALHVKLLFSMNVRGKVRPELPRGYYGNGFVLGCAESAAGTLVTSNAQYAVKLVQEAKRRVDDDYVRSMVDLLEQKRGRPDLSATLVVSAWTRLGLEDVDFGAGRPLHMGPLTSEIYCVFLPVIGDPHGVTVLVSVPQAAAERFEHWCVKGLDGAEETAMDAAQHVVA